jgi:hypothetical protein
VRGATSDDLHDVFELLGVERRLEEDFDLDVLRPVHTFGCGNV